MHEKNAVSDAIFICNPLRCCGLQQIMSDTGLQLMKIRKIHVPTQVVDPVNSRQIYTLECTARGKSAATAAVFSPNMIGCLTSREVLVERYPIRLPLHGGTCSTVQE